jgi:hypothetical protein
LRDDCLQSPWRFLRHSRVSDNFFVITIIFEGMLAKKTSHPHFYASVYTLLMMHMSIKIKTFFCETIIISIDKRIRTATEDTLQLGSGKQNKYQ